MMEDLCSPIQDGTTSCSQWWKSFVLPSRLEPHPTTMMEEFRTFIQVETKSYHNDGRSLFFHLGQNHILLTMMEEFCTSIQARTHPTHNYVRLSPRTEHILPKWWNISTHSPRQEHILPQWLKTLTQAETHPTAMMKYFRTFTQAGTHPTTMMKDSHLDQNTSYHND